MSKETIYCRIYEYDVHLSGLDAEKSVNGKYIIYFDGKRCEIECDVFRFYSNYKLTYYEALDRVKGTKGIEYLVGDIGTIVDKLARSEETKLHF
jgi:hypothetical protein